MEKKILTTSTGGHVDNDQSSITTREPAETVMSDVHLFDKMAHFNRERVPERVVHAKGAGAYGVFKVENDLTQYTAAKFLNKIGKETEVFVRFSTVGGERGSADTARDPRGFAVKFYTEDGNYDLVGNATPVFFIRDAIKFPDFIHSQKRNPVTNLPDPNAYWDFLSISPSSMHMLLRLMSDTGTPDGFRKMDGFGIHTFMWYKNSKDFVWVKYTWKTVQGIKNLTHDKATELAGTNPDYATEDLYESIKNGDYPSWDLFVQIMTDEQAKAYRYNIFDTTKIIYEEDYPLIKVGRMTLNRLPKNFFDEVEQAAFCPGNIVHGIGLSPDKMLNVRAVMYTDTQRHRIGTNFNHLKVNAPKSPVNNYQSDGAMSQGGSGEPNYYPNSFGGAEPSMAYAAPPIMIERGEMARHDEPVTPIDYEQPKRYYDELSESDKENLVYNTTQLLQKANYMIQYRQAALFYITSEDLGKRISDSLGLELESVQYLASLTEEERLKQTMPNVN